MSPDCQRCLALEFAHASPELLLAVALLLAGELLAAALEQLVAPRVIERLGDLVVAADVLHRPVTGPRSLVHPL